MNFKINNAVRWCYRTMTVPSVFLAGCLITTVPFSIVRAADSDDTNTKSTYVTATVISTACTVVLSPTSLPTFDVDSSTLRQNTVSAPTQKVSLSLSACGIGYLAKKPVVTLSGTHPDPTELPAGTDPAMVFKDAYDAMSNTSQGFWVVVGRVPSPAATYEDLYSDGDEVLTGVVNSKGNEASSPAKNDIYIGVSCMNSTPCGKQAGSLKASLKFTFKYN